MALDLKVALDFCSRVLFYGGIGLINLGPEELTAPIECVSLQQETCYDLIISVLNRQGVHDAPKMT